MLRLLLCAVVLAFGILASSCAPDDAGQARQRSEDEATSVRASSGERRVFGVQGIPPGWGEAVLEDEPKRSPGVRAEGATLTGTGGDDLIVAGGGTQTVRGLGGGDALSGSRRRDRIYGGSGDDLINAQGDGKRDAIDCGPGRDEVLMNAEDGEKPCRCEFTGVGIG